jgi:hypothetical protein
MAYREVIVWEILNVLGRVRRGENKSAMTRATKHSAPAARAHGEQVPAHRGWRGMGRRHSPPRSVVRVASHQVLI